jgi:hypothetical protein
MHVDVIMKFCIKIHTFDIYMMDFPIAMCSDAQNSVDSGHVHSQSECLRIIYPVFLVLSICDKSRSEFELFSIWSMFRR